MNIDEKCRKRINTIKCTADEHEWLLSLYTNVYLFHFWVNQHIFSYNERAKDIATTRTCLATQGIITILSTLMKTYSNVMTWWLRRAMTNAKGHPNKNFQFTKKKRETRARTHIIERE